MNSPEARLKRRLPHVWHAFFGRFGRLTDTQAQAIAPIVEGRSVVLCAPTASGKTEAVLGPMIERVTQADRRARDLRLLVVCPTRALCNDLNRRIHRPVSACGWRVGLKTGDSPGFDEKSPPQVLVTTPESLDSMLSRRPAALRRVDGLFLDELHLLYGGGRGDHLMALTERLRSFRPDLQLCAASATAADARRMARDFAGPDAEVVAVEGGRDRRLDIQMARASTVLQAAGYIRQRAQAEPGSKLLVFANTRAEVEWLAAEMPGPTTFAHHGSLSKPERLRVEKAFLNAPSGICVATMTLELGVDIGDVDCAVLVNPPPNVASFTQRIGRANRRGDRVRALCLWSCDFDRRRFEHMVACAEAGRLFPEPIAFRPTILAQQAVSLAFQNPKGWVTAEALHKRLPRPARDAYSRGDCAEVLAGMRRDGYLHADSRGRYVPDEPAQKDFRYGRIHTHIEPDPEIEVVDEATGRMVGTADWNAHEKARSESRQDDGLLLGGRHHRVTRVRDRRVYVEATDPDKEPQFLSRMGPRYSFELARDLAEFVGLGPREIRLVRTGVHSWRLDHFFGTLWGHLLGAVLGARGFGMSRPHPFSTDVSGLPRRIPDTLGPAARIEDEVRRFLEAGYRQLVKPLQPGPWRRHTPDELLHRWVHDCVRPADFAETAAGFRLTEG